MTEFRDDLTPFYWTTTVNTNTLFDKEGGLEWILYPVPTAGNGITQLSDASEAGTEQVVDLQIVDLQPV